MIAGYVASDILRRLVLGSSRRASQGFRRCGRGISPKR